MKACCDRAEFMFAIIKQLHVCYSYAGGRLCDATRNL